MSPAIERIVALLRAGFDEEPRLQHEESDGWAVIVKRDNVTYAVFYSDVFVENYPSQKAIYDKKLSYLVAVLTHAPSRAVLVTDDCEIQHFKSQIVFQSES